MSRYGFRVLYKHLTEHVEEKLEFLRCRFAMADLVDCGLESEKDLVKILYECFRNKQYFVSIIKILHGDCQAL